MNQSAANLNVLVVDDDTTMLDLLEAELEDKGFRVTKASDLATLYKRISERSFDLVLLDLFLGQEKGLEAIPVLVRETPYTKVVIMSASGTIELAVDALEKGASSFLCKSKDPRELVKALLDKVIAADTKTDAVAVPVTESSGIIGKTDAVHQVLAKINQYKDVDSTVLITGESGTGKELVARAIHNSSVRANKRFEAINCGAIPENLLESELFGHRRGAFTDAKTDRKGLFEICHQGTLFLDEIGEMPLGLQVKLLRVLQEREISPLGSAQTVKVDTRVLAASNRNLSEEVKKGNFRADLFYRLNVLNLELPPLRDRRQDIPLLLNYFLKRFNTRFSKNILPPSKEVEARLLQYGWPGNIRELQNAIERGVVLSTDGELHFEHMLDLSRANAEPEATANHEDTPLWTGPLSEAKKQFEKAYLQHLLKSTQGNVSEVARISGRYRTDIYRLMTKYGLESEEFRS